MLAIPIISILLLLELPHRVVAANDAGSSFDCRCWAAQGQCDSNAAFMLNHCAGSCAWKKSCDSYEDRGTKQENECQAALERAQARIKELEQRLAKYEGISPGFEEALQEEKREDTPRQTTTSEVTQQHCSNGEAACSNQDSGFADFTEQLAKLTTAQAQFDANNSIAHSELEAQSAALLERINALEQHMRNAPVTQAISPSGRVVDSMAEPPLEYVKESSAAWYNKFSMSDLAGNMSAHAQSFYDDVAQPLTQRAWDATIMVQDYSYSSFGKLRNYTQDLSPHVWVLLEDAREHGGLLLRQSWTSIYELSNHAIEHLSNATNTTVSSGLDTETSFEFPVIGKASLPVVGALLLLVLIFFGLFRKRLRQIASLPVLLLRSLLKLLVRILFFPISLLHRCLCCCRKNTKNQNNDGSQPVKADLGLKSAFYYDKDKGKWRERGKEHLEVDAVAPPPPPMMGSQPMPSPGPSPTLAPAQPPSALDNLMAPPNPHSGVLHKRPPQAGPLAARSVGLDSVQPPAFDSQMVPPNSAANIGRRPGPKPIVASSSPFGAPKANAPTAKPSAPVVYNLSPRAPEDNDSLSSLFGNNVL